MPLACAIRPHCAAMWKPGLERQMPQPSSLTLAPLETLPSWIMNQ